MYSPVLSEEEKQIEEWFKAAYHALQQQYGRYRVPSEMEWELSEEYKSRHQRLIDRRKTDEVQQARVQAFTATHSERVCRDCNTSLPPHIGRGRPAVRCESCRNELAAKS